MLHIVLGLLYFYCFRDFVSFISFFFFLCFPNLSLECRFGRLFVKKYNLLKKLT